MNRILTALAITMALLAFDSCKNRHKAQDNPRNRESDPKEILNRHQQSHLQFKTLTLKGKAEYEDQLKNENLSFTYKICIAKDSLICANISKLSLPAANMLVDRDSVRIRMPLTKEAVRCDFRILSSMAGMEVDFDLLQAFLVGDGKIDENATFTPTPESPIQYQSERPPYQLSWILNNAHWKLEKMLVKDLKLARESTLEYSAFKKVDGQWMPTLMKLLATRPEITRIELNHTDIGIDSDDANFSFRIPEGYEIKPCVLK